MEIWYFPLITISTISTIALIESSSASNAWDCSSWPKGLRQSCLASGFGKRAFIAQSDEDSLAKEDSGLSHRTDFFKKEKSTSLEDWLLSNSLKTLEKRANLADDDTLLAALADIEGYELVAKVRPRASQQLKERAYPSEASEESRRSLSELLGLYKLKQLPHTDR
ncbi:uncharacterized protein [Watersipora subatra]|uniref:uncharacterized protein n=1 Tax=Watersipora subatra TaxID=2589382 RepID=UPI00355B8D01